MQAERDKALTAMHPAAMERAGYWFRDVSIPAPAPSPTQVDAPAPASADFSTLTDAEQYAVLYPDRAARIRVAGGLPARRDFVPPEAEIVQAIVNGTSPILRALDQHPAAGAAAQQTSHPRRHGIANMNRETVSILP